jgi:hypothetical protein
VAFRNSRTPFQIAGLQPAVIVDSVSQAGMLGKMAAYTTRVTAAGDRKAPARISRPRTNSARLLAAPS